MYISHQDISTDDEVQESATSRVQFWVHQGECRDREIGAFIRPAKVAELFLSLLHHHRPDGLSAWTHIHDQCTAGLPPLSDINEIMDFGAMKDSSG